MTDELRDKIVEAALAWERARQHAMHPDPPLFVERDSEELSHRLHAYSEREKALRALLRQFEAAQAAS